MAITIPANFTSNSKKAIPRNLLGASDGDTPNIKQPIRMVSCDTAEKAQYAGAPPKAQLKLDRTRQRLTNGLLKDLPPHLRNYLTKKLMPRAAADHIAAATEASKQFKQLLSRRLRKANRKSRRLGVIATGEIIDVYGRLLAYLSPWYDGTKTDPIPPKASPKRTTFNLNMVENGWAASFPIYPSLPKNKDWQRFLAAAKTAWDKQRGQWNAHGKSLLLGYEYRMCIKLARTAKKGEVLTGKTLIDEAFQRVCVDARNGKILGRFDFSKIDPPYRVWVWEKDLPEAKSKLKLLY